MAAFGFTPANNEDFFSAGAKQQSRCKFKSALSGEEIRNFYEGLIKGGDEEPKSSKSEFNKRTNGRSRVSKPKNRDSIRRQRRVGDAEVQRDQAGSAAPQGGGEAEATPRERSDSERCVELLGLRFLRCAHTGDIPGLRDLLSKGVDINFQDTYLWTAIMCASWSGQRAAVKLLLQHGAAWVGVVDMQGRDATHLAVEAGHKDVLEELENYGKHKPKETKSDSALQMQWCEVCGSSYSSSSLSSHLSSTLHQFSLHRPPPTPFYCLPASSNSYKMMLRSGWTPGRGLGPEGEGPHQPVPTVLKRDQKGLGYGPVKRAKVTHFQARDRDAVKPPTQVKEERIGKGKRKEDSRRKEQRDKNWERDFRASFYL
ncbi:G patch domain and ankyrin repeat-containing protein 1 isoform X2 [Cynoglossus semilaevis]|nr:G patch domain and ankyrin repeat-containing protein 1 isoform X2 [Cynoglossus semilaevis]